MNASLGIRPVKRALVLAAGRSSRIQVLASGRPKPLLAIGGRSVLEHNLRHLAAGGVQEVWINLHYRGEQIEALVGDGTRFDLQVKYSWEPELLGTAGALRKLHREFADSTFLVVYGDNLTSLDFASMAKWHRQHDALITIAVFDRERIPNTGMAGGRVLIADDGRIQDFVEGSESCSPYVNAGVYLIEPAVIDMIPPATVYDFGRDLFPSLIRQGAPLTAYTITGYCLGIDTPEALHRAEELIRILHPHQENITR